jgi:CRISPR-associated protein Csd1
VIEELLRIADIQGLSGHEAERSRPVHWLIDLDANGNPLQLSPTVETARSNGGKLRESRGKSFSVPRNYHMRRMPNGVGSVGTNDSNWAPAFLTFKASEFFVGDIFGIRSKNPGRDRRRRVRTWRLLLEANRDSKLSKNSALLAVIRFLRSRPRIDSLEIPFNDPVERESVAKVIAEEKELLSFRVAGKLAIHDPELRKWWADRVALTRADVCSILPQGEDSYESGTGPLAVFHPPVFNSIPLFSYDKPPFMSFGLGKQTTRLRLNTSEKMAAALNWLMNDESSSLKIGDYVAVFWATTADRSVSVDFAKLLDASDPLAVRDFLRGPWGGLERDLETTKFHAALLRKSGKGRFAVNSWHTDTLGKGKQNVNAWFTAIEIPRFQSQDRLFLTIRQLADCTVLKSRETRPLPCTYQMLFESALFGSPMPHKLLAMVLARQCLELAKGTDKKKPSEFENRLAARTAMIQVFFAFTKGQPMPDLVQNLETNSGYLCGRLLAFLDRIHVAAHRDSGGTSSSPANRAYGAASTTPALIFPQLCKLVRYHLNKIGGGLAYRLEFGYEDPPFEGLAAICARLRTSGAEFPRTLSLEDQGRFAIGFYYERCRPWPAKTDDASTAHPEK